MIMVNRSVPLDRVMMAIFAAMSDEYGLGAIATPEIDAAT